jgi:hypothetical protein
MERLTANAKIATVLGSNPSILRHVESEGRADEAVLNKVPKMYPKKTPEKNICDN